LIWDQEAAARYLATLGDELKVVARRIANHLLELVGDTCEYVLFERYRRKRGSDPYELMELVWIEMNAAIKETHANRDAPGWKRMEKAVV
jgi:hypothetical protein